MNSRRAPLALLLLVACTLAQPACTPPVPTQDAGPVVTPASWVSTARTTLVVLQFALPAMKLLLPSVLPGTAGIVVGRVLDGTAATLPRLDHALTTYEATRAAGTRCEARAAADATLEALLALADALGAQGFSLASEAELALGGLSGIVDELAPACRPDAGTPPLSAHARIARHGSVSPLRPFPPLAPPMDGGAP